ncbi:hypothetical protein [Marinomonas sp. 2405UD68-3]|uniref:hypothetical protein n=1 Tax=Marinomonas sp. 2405UD68-3 TaxID=3391835 RepID=UPI0039C9332A
MKTASIQMLIDYIAKMSDLLKELEHTIDEHDIEKAKLVISEFNVETKKTLEDSSKLDESHYKSIQASLDRLNELIIKVADIQKSKGVELGTIVNVKKKLNVYKNNK